MNHYYLKIKKSTMKGSGMGNDFSNVKINDEVFHLCYGKCVVIAVPKKEHDYFSITCIDAIGKFDIRLTVTGRRNESDLNPCVFWDEVIITPPPKPKRKIEKIAEWWLNVYKDDETNNLFFYDYKTKQNADEKADKKNRLGEAYHVIHKYTVEE